MDSGILNSPLDTTNCSNPPDSSVSGTYVTEEDGGSHSSDDLETKTEAELSLSLEQRLNSAKQDTEDTGHTGTVFEDVNYNEGQKENDVTDSKRKAGDICPTETNFQNSGCITDSMKDIDQKNPRGSKKYMPPHYSEKLDDTKQTAENRRTIDFVAPQKEQQGKTNKDTPATTIDSKCDADFRDEKMQAKTEPTLNPNSSQSTVCSENNKQIVAKKMIVQTQSVQSEKEVQSSVSPEGPIINIDQQNLNEYRKNMPPSDQEKFHEVERTAENSHIIKDFVALHKEHQGESNKDTPATTTELKYDVVLREKKKQSKVENTLNPSSVHSTVCSERNKDIVTEKDNVQDSDSLKDGLRKRHEVVKLVPQADKPIEELKAKNVEEQPFSCEIREEKHTIWKLAFFVSGFVFFVLVLYFYCFGSTPSSDSTAVMKFLKEFEKLKAEFPGQNEALWLRSGKMLQKHLNKSQPLEPAMMILTAAQDGEHTLRCLSIGLARSYATSLNSSWNVIDGPSKAAYDSTTTKLQIDESLSLGFESTCRAAVLHRIEELAPASLLILYKYCDHENAVFKNVALVLTVLLKQSTLKSDQTLREVEEQVKDFLWEKCTSQGSGNSYNEMNSDKMSGVWSRISHLVLPVYPVQSLESGSCRWSELKKTLN